MERRSVGSSRLKRLDGLRGVTALAIVLTHIYWEVCPRGDAGELPAWLATLLQPIAFSGKVGVFLALSGYSLLHSTLDRDTLHGWEGGKKFFRRRAEKILPAYYAALVLCLALTALVPFLRTSRDARWALALPAFSADALLPHLFLVQNLEPGWMLRIDPPLWVLALEWQLYFVFALVLLPLYRWKGRLAALAAAAILSFVLHKICFWTSPWFLLIFCFGMLAASWRGNREVERLAHVTTALLTVPFAVQVLLGNAWRQLHQIRSDLLTGLFIASLLVGSPKIVVLSLETRPALWLGRISYSLYLVHFPLLALCHGAILNAFPALSPPLRLGLLFLFGVPITLSAAYAFHCGIKYVNGRFLTGRAEDSLRENGSPEEELPPVRARGAR